MNQNESHFVYLEVEGLTRGVTLPDARLLLLREKNGDKQHLAVIVNRDEYAWLEQAMRHEEFPTVEMMRKLAKTFDIQVIGVQICYSQAGKFRGVVHVEGYGECREMETSIGQAALVAMREQCPLYILRKEFKRLSGNNNRNGEVAVPLASMQTGLLRQALEQAVKDDNYELASQLRDELRGREGE